MYPLGRRSPSLLALILICGSSFVFSGCGAYFISGCVNTTPAPKLTSISPTTIDTRSLPMTLVVTGSDFQTWSKIQWNSATLPTDYVDSSHLSTILTTGTLEGLNLSGGTGAISVFTFDPQHCTNGASSSNITITITIVN